MKERKQEQDPTVKDEPGSQPKKYYKGLSKKEKEARAKHLQRVVLDQHRVMMMLKLNQVNIL